MRLVILTAALAVLSFPAFAQQQPQQPQRQLPPRQPAQQQPAPAPAPQQQPAQQQQQQSDAVPGMFACRNEAEVCFIAIVVGGNRVSVLYTNDPNAEGLDATPINVQGPPDMTQQMGRVVMMTGQYNAQSGLSRAEVIDVASPLLSFAIKSILSGNEEEEPEEPPAPAPRQPQRQQQQQPRR